MRPPAGDGGLGNYRILSGAEGKFEIDESTGLIITVDYLDYETKTSYLMNVSATQEALGTPTLRCTFLHHIHHNKMYPHST